MNPSRQEGQQDVPRTAAGRELLGVVMRLGRSFVADIDWTRRTILAIEAEAAAGQREAALDAPAVIAQKYHDPGPYTGDCCYGNYDDAHAHGYERGWNAALDEVARRLATPPAGAPKQNPGHDPGCTGALVLCDCGKWCCP